MFPTILKRSVKKDWPRHLCAIVVKNWKSIVLFSSLFVDHGRNVIDTYQACTFHDGCKQGIDKQIFKKSISRKITHPQSW